MLSKLIHGEHEDVSFGSLPQTYLLLQSLCLWSRFDVVHSFEVQFDVGFLKLNRKRTSREMGSIIYLVEGMFRNCFIFNSFITRIAC